MAVADIAGPSVWLSEAANSWVTWVVVLVCVLAIVAVATGIFFIRRSKAKRPGV